MRWAAREGQVGIGFRTFLEFLVTVLVYLDSVGAELSPSQKDVVAVAAGVGPVAVAVGAAVSPDAVAALGAAGVQRVYAAEQDPSGSLSVGQADLLVGAVRASEAVAVLSGIEPIETEVMARAAALTESALITQVSSIAFATEGELANATGLAVRKNVLSGEWSSEVRPTTAMTFLTLVPGIPAQTPAPVESPEVVSVSTGGREGAQVLSRTPVVNGGRPDVSSARVVVAGGRGTDGDFGPVEQLADALGGAVGSTRDATDEGWIPHNTQVGQTGATVRPELYIAAGISGAVHHVAGMRQSGTIVVVNNDMDAPIFDIADFGVVGDLNTVLPQAAEAIRARKQQG